MISIKDRKILGQIFSHYDYVMTTAQLSKEKLYYRDVQRMLEAGLIERIKRGYYHWAAGSGKGDVVIISRLFPDGILCMETALFYYGYSDILRFGLKQTQHFLSHIVSKTQQKCKRDLRLSLATIAKAILRL